MRLCKRTVGSAFLVSVFSGLVVGAPSDPAPWEPNKSCPTSLIGEGAGLCKNANDDCYGVVYTGEEPVICHGCTRTTGFWRECIAEPNVQCRPITSSGSGGIYDCLQPEKGECVQQSLSCENKRIGGTATCGVRNCEAQMVP